MKEYKYFSTEELACRCGCGLQNIHDGFMRRIIRARVYAKLLCKKFYIDEKNARFVVTSGCRCLEHNKKVSRYLPLKSSHIASVKKPSHAMDIAFADTKQLLVIVASLVCRGGFTHIGIDLKKNYIHVDDKSMWLWFY